MQSKWLWSRFFNVTSVSLNCLVCTHANTLLFSSSFLYICSVDTYLINICPSFSNLSSFLFQSSHGWNTKKASSIPLWKVYSFLANWPFSLYFLSVHVLWQYGYTDNIICLWLFNILFFSPSPVQMAHYKFKWEFSSLSLCESILL